MSLALLALLPQLINAGIATEQQVAGLIKSFHSGLTDAEANAVLELVRADAQRRKALADADLKPNVVVLVSPDPKPQP